MATIIVTGIMVGWFETGLEGIVWALQTEDANYEGLFVIDEGDYLTIKSPSGELLFEGIIDPDTEIGKLPRPFSNILQPCAQGRWVSLDTARLSTR